MCYMFRELREDEIEVRIGSCNAGGVNLLLYKNARVDQSILDETVQPMNWQKGYEVVNGNLFCTVSIWDGEKKMWISKSDVGVESYAEKEKGQASDAFKRACFAWGIGRELYTTGELFVPKEKLKSHKEAGEYQGKKKYACYDSFYVEKIKYDEKRNIIALSIVDNDTGKRVYVKCPPENTGKK